MYYENYRRRLRREELRKKAREAKAPSRYGGTAGGSDNGCDCADSSSGKGASSAIPAVAANLSMDSVDSTVDLSYASDTMDTSTSATSSAASADGVEEDDSKVSCTKAAASAAHKQQHRRRLIAAAAATATAGVPSTIPGGAQTSTHIHVTTSSAFTRTVDWQRKTSAATVAVSNAGVHAHQQQQHQQCRGKRLICLISNGVADRVQAHRQLHALNILNVRQTPYEAVDGMDPAQRRRRDELFGISGIRGHYPQFFVERQMDNGYGGTRSQVEYWGNFEMMESLNEVDGLPPELLLANPEVETWDNVFGDCH